MHEMGEEFQRELWAMLVRMSCMEHDFVVRGRGLTSLSAGVLEDPASSSLGGGLEGLGGSGLFGSLGGAGGGGGGEEDEAAGRRRRWRRWRRRQRRSLKQRAPLLAVRRKPRPWARGRGR